MDVFGKIGDTIVNVGKDVSSKAKELSGVTKLKMRYPYESSKTP